MFAFGKPFLCFLFNFWFRSSDRNFVFKSYNSDSTFRRSDRISGPVIDDSTNPSDDWLESLDIRFKYLIQRPSFLLKQMNWIRGVSSEYVMCENVLFFRDWSPKLHLAIIVFMEWRDNNIPRYHCLDSCLLQVSMRLECRFCLICVRWYVFNEVVCCFSSVNWPIFQKLDSELVCKIVHEELVCKIVHEIEKKSWTLDFPFWLWGGGFL